MSERVAEHVNAATTCAYHAAMARFRDAEAARHAADRAREDVVDLLGCLDTDGGAALSVAVDKATLYDAHRAAIDAYVAHHHAPPRAACWTLALCRDVAAEAAAAAVGVLGSFGEVERLIHAKAAAAAARAAAVIADRNAQACARRAAGE